MIIHSRSPLPQPMLTILSQRNSAKQFLTKLKFSSLGYTHNTLFLSGWSWYRATISLHLLSLYKSRISATMSIVQNADVSSNIDCELRIHRACPSLHNTLPCDLSVELLSRDGFRIDNGSTLK